MLGKLLNEQFQNPNDIVTGEQMLGPGTILGSPHDFKMTLHQRNSSEYSWTDYLLQDSKMNRSYSEEN
jgi:hypothetical protein